MESRKSWIIAGAVIIVALICVFVWRSGGHYPQEGPLARPDVVFRDPESGSVRQVEAYLKQKYPTAGEYRGGSWSSIVQRSDGTYMVEHKYRVWNSAGKMLDYDQTFILDAEGTILSVLDHH